MKIFKQVKYSRLDRKNWVHFTNATIEFATEPPGLVATVNGTEMESWDLSEAALVRNKGKALWRELTIGFRFVNARNESHRFQFRFKDAVDFNFSIEFLSKFICCKKIGDEGTQGPSDCSQADPNNFYSQLQETVTYPHLVSNQSPSLTEVRQVFKRATADSLQSIVDVSNSLLQLPSQSLQNSRLSTTLVSSTTTGGTLPDSSQTLVNNNNNGNDDLRKAIIPDFDSKEGLQLWIDHILGDPEFPAYVCMVENLWAERMLRM